MSNASRSTIHHAVRAVLLLVFLARFASVTLADDKERNARINYKSQLLDQLEARVDLLNEDALVRLTPALVKLLERQEPTLDWRILKLLSEVDLSGVSEPRRFVESISRLLDSPEQATRSLAVAVLCNVGESGIASSRENLKSRSPRVRACSVVILARLGKLSEAEAIDLSRDADPRVRVATIPVLGRSKKGTDALIGMLTDEETAVASRAADEIGRVPSRGDPEILVEALSNALARPEVSFFAAQSLARMGSDARSAIPSLLANFPVGYPRNFSYDDMAELALPRIGRARPEDIPKIARLLDSNNVERCILVCQTLARSGVEAKPASAQLAVTMRTSLEKERKQNEELELRSDEDEFDGQKQQRFVIAADAALSAFWFTTRDKPAFRALAEEWPDNLWLGHDFWSSTGDSDRAELIEYCLLSENKNVVFEALQGITISSPMPHLEPLVQPLVQMDASENPEVLAEAWLNTLSPTSPNVEERTLVALENGFISIEQFARFSKRLGCSSMRSRKLLLDNAKTLEKYSARDCAEAYLRLADDKDRIQAISELSKLSRLGSDWLPGIIAQEKWGSPNLLTLAQSASRSSDYWTRIHGIRILGNIGRDASGSTSEIVALFEKELSKNKRQVSETLVSCAIVLFKISGDLSYVDRTLQHIARFEEDDNFNPIYFDYRRQRILEEVVTPGSKYIDLIVDCLDEQRLQLVSGFDSRNDFVDGWIRLALKTESPKARESVARLSKSRDALLSKMARRRLSDGP